MKKLTRVLLSITLGIALHGAAFAQAPTRKLQFQIDWRAEPFYAGVYVAKEKGWFKDDGLEVEILQGNGAGNAAQLIGVGIGPVIGTSAGSETVIARSKGVPVKSVAVLVPQTPYVLVSLPRAPISQPKDLIGKRVGLIPGTVTTDEFYALLKANDLSRDQIQEVSVDWSVAPLLSGQVDALIYSEDNVPLQLSLDGYNPTVLRFRDYGINMYSLNIIANDGAIASNPANLAIVTRDVVRGYEFVRSNPDEAADIFLKLFPERNATYVRASIKVVGALLGKGQVGLQTDEGWRRTIDTLASLSALKAPVATEDVYTNLAR